jgi:hypothetical protein
MFTQSYQKVSWRAEIVLSALFLFSSLVCLVVNYSIDHSFSWSLYPTGALFMIWATVTPLLIFKKNKDLGALAGLCCTLIPFLLLAQWLVPAKGWFLPLALPLALLVLVSLGICIAAFRFIKNKLYSVALTIFLFGVLVNYGVGVIIKNYLPYSGFDEISRMSTIAASGMLSVLILVIGSIKKTIVRS